MKVLVFIGSVRDPIRMLDTIDELVAAGDAPDRILLSSWFGEIERHEGLREALLDRGTDLVEADEPIPFRAQPLSYVHRGHIYHQKFALANALDMLDDEDFVIKSRPDVKFHDTERLRRLLRLKPEPVGSDLLPFISFDTRVAISTHFIGSPFWLDDTHFAGTAETLRLMTSLDASYDISRNPHVAIPEVRFYHALFAGRFPVIERLLRLPYNFGYFYEHGERDAFLKVALADAFIAKAFYAYYRLISASCDMSGLYDRTIVDADTLVAAHVAAFKHLDDGQALLRVQALWRDVRDKTMFTALAQDTYTSSDEWQHCQDALWPLGVTSSPRTVYTPGHAQIVPSKPSLADARAAAATFSSSVDEVRRRLDSTFSRARIAAYVPATLSAASTYRSIGLIRLAPGDVVWDTLLTAHPLEIAYAWTRSDDPDPPLRGGVSLGHSIVSDWVFFLPLVAPMGIGRWELLICMRCPTMGSRWLDLHKTVDVTAEP